MTLGWILWLASLLPQPLADQTCLATTIYLEARSEPVIGQFAVAEVALRRQEEGRWGESVCDVVTAPWQFATATTAKDYRVSNLDAWNTAWRIAGTTIRTWELPADQRVVVVPGADHFVELAVATPAWSRNKPLRTIGDHTFYDVD